MTANETMSKEEVDRWARREIRRHRLTLAPVATESKTCGCGRCYTRVEFLALPHAANGGEGLGLLWRNCACNSTLTMGA